MCKRLTGSGGLITIGEYMDQYISFKSLAKMIDHSLLHPTMTDAKIFKGCNTAKKYNVANVSIKPCAIEMRKIILKVLTWEFVLL
jgi:deoxyribose-phosphate aldolase